MITFCILTKNNEESIAETLSSLLSFPEVILVDNGSSDRTLEIANTFNNVRIETRDFSGFGSLRNWAAQHARHEWVMALDSDEVLSNELQQELKELPLNDPEYVYEFPFKNFYRGKQIKGCGWHPEFHIRLYHKNHTRFSDSLVHEGVLTHKTKKIRLNHPILHTPYRTTADFLRKMQHYSNLFAQQHCGKKKSSFKTALLHGFGAFMKTYFLKRGFLMRREGFTISLYNANTAFYKYLKLEELNAARSPLSSR